MAKLAASLLVSWLFFLIGGFTLEWHKSAAFDLLREASQGKQIG